MTMNTMRSAIYLGGLLAVIALAMEECGATDNRIVGGRPAEEGEFPYQVSLRRSYNDKHFCGGSLITENHILTAAHCMYYQWGGVLPPIVVSVVAGQLNLTMKADSVFRNVSEIIIHPEFNKTSMENDVAILKLTQSFPITHLISLIPLAQRDDHHIDCVVSGWGVQAFESPLVSESLLTTEVKRISNQQCDAMYGNDTIFPSMMCAYDEEGEHDACQGDSGGPLVTSGYLIGVISTGEGCASKQYPGIYASVPFLYDWIVENVRLTNSTNASTTEASTNYTGDDISEPSSEQTTKGPQATASTTGSRIPDSNNHSKNTTTTPKIVDDDFNYISHNETRPVIHIGDHSRTPDDIETSGPSGVGSLAMLPTMLMTLVIISIRLIL